MGPESRVLQKRPTPSALQILTFTSPTSARQLSHFTLPSQSKQCHQRPLLCSRSVLECQFFDKSFRSCVRGCISNTATKAFFVHFTYCLVIVYRTHITSVKNERFPPNHRPIERLTTNYHGQSQPQTTQTQEAILLQSDGVGAVEKERQRAHDAVHDERQYTALKINACKSSILFVYLQSTILT